MKTFTRPLSIRIIAALYILSPIVNLAYAALMARGGAGADGAIAQALHNFGVIGLLLVCSGPLVGAGIYSGRRLGIVAFLLHAVAVVAFNGWIVATHQQPDILVMIATDVVVFGLTANLLRKDMRAPYLADGQRGWRDTQRVIRELPVKLSGNGSQTSGVTVNVSRTGLLVRASASSFKVDDAVKVSLDADGKTFEADAKIVWVEASGTMGVTFPSLSDAAREQLWALVA